MALTGMAGVFASAKIYLVPARPSWNTIRTPLRFFLTGFILGPLFAWLVYALYQVRISQESLSKASLGPVAIFFAVAGLATFLQLFVSLSRLVHLWDKQSDELYGSSVLLIRRFRSHFLLRIALLLLGGFVLPAPLFFFLAGGMLNPWTLLTIAALSFFFSLGGELLGRYLFFVTVVPKNMPGSFFTRNGGGH